MNKIKLRRPGQKLYGLMGYAGAGKDTVAAELGIPRAAFADALKEMCLPIAQELGLDIIHNRADKELFREVLVAVGRTARQVDPDFWIKRLVLPDSDAAVITDIRYLSEVNAVREAGGQVGWVVRTGVGAANEEERESFREIADQRFIPGGYLFEFITNFSTPEEAGRHAREVFGIPQPKRLPLLDNSADAAYGPEHGLRGTYPVYGSVSNFAAEEPVVLEGEVVPFEGNELADVVNGIVDMDACGTIDGITPLPLEER